MPSSRRQKAKARESTEKDKMSNFENKDVVLGSDNLNPIERELSNVIGKTENHCDNESTWQSSENSSHENTCGHYVHENMIPRNSEGNNWFKSRISKKDSRPAVYLRDNRDSSPIQKSEER